jgi:hypothetical protein
LPPLRLPEPPRLRSVACAQKSSCSFTTSGHRQRPPRLPSITVRIRTRAGTAGRWSGISSWAPVCASRSFSVWPWTTGPKARVEDARSKARQRLAGARVHQVPRLLGRMETGPSRPIAAYVLDTVTEKLAAVTSALDGGAAVIQFSRLLVLRAQEPATSLDSFVRARRNDQSWHGGASVSASVRVSSPVKCMPVA